MTNQKKAQSGPSDSELEKYVAERKEARKQALKRAGIIIICVALVFAFCLPAVGTLLNQPRLAICFLAIRLPVY